MSIGWIIFEQRLSPLTREQDDTSLADRFSRGGLPFTVGHLHGGLAMQDNSLYAEAAEINEDKLDETRSNEAHSRHVAHQQDPCISRTPVQANPLKGWNNAYHGTSRCGIICPTHARVTEEGARVSNLRNNRNRGW